jgi:ubiquinone/menaquinone biosynthesis C-methylase UbiE
MKNIFNEHYKRYDAWYDKNEPAYLSEIKALKKVVPRTGSGLEIGVGTGRFAVALDIGHGVEPSDNMAELARNRGIAVEIAYGEELPFCDERFDYVAIIIALCFVHNPHKVLEESRRVLKKNGKLIIGIVDKDSFLGKRYKKKKSIFYTDAHLFSVCEVTALVQKSKFNVLSYWQTLCEPQELSVVQEPIKGFGQGGFVVIECQKR